MNLVSPALGVSFDGRSSTVLEHLAPFVDVVEIAPDRFVTKYTDAVDNRMFAAVDEHASHLDVAYHGVGLSMGTASGWNEEYLALLEGLCARRPPRRHSEHLGFTFVDGHFLGTMAAVPATLAVADLMAERAEAIYQRFGLDFLLEHVASPFARPDEMSSASFLTYVAWNSGCGLVLDLYNLECDEDNGKLFVDEFLDELDLTLVKEIHVAGGMWRDGYHLDVHTQLPAASTLALLDAALPRCPNVDLVVFEMVGVALDRVERDELVATVRDLRSRIEVAGVVG
jgi:uncharacterized protein (UPF0276 family)